MREQVTQPTPLVCDQCLRAPTATATAAAGVLELVLLCPDCWRREFGDRS